MELKMTIDNEFLEETVKTYVDDLKENFVQMSAIDSIKEEIIHLHDWCFDRETILKIIDDCVKESKK